jgi:hypothetical protein
MRVQQVVPMTSWPPPGYRLHPGGGLVQVDPLPVTASTNGLRLTRLSDVEIRRARFAWDPRIPLGTLTLLAGVPGQGKSHMAIWLASRLTRGQLDGDLQGVASNVVVASAEDALSFTLTPRFVAAGADLDRVHSVAVHHDGTDLGISIPDDLEVIRLALANTDARLLVIDPLLAHIPVRIDGYKDQHVRQALAPLARLAEELGVAVLAVMHLNKRETSDLFTRLGGSPDPKDPDVRILAHGKANLSLHAPSLRFRLEGQEIPNPDPDDVTPIPVASVAMLGESDLDVGGLLGGRGTTKEGDAMAWLVQLLGNGPMPASWIEQAASEAGHSWATVRRAKADLGVVSDRIGFGAEGRFEWSLPKEDA